MKNVITNDYFYTDIKNILQKARDTAYKQVNFIMVEAYWNIANKQQNMNKMKKIEPNMANISSMNFLLDLQKILAKGITVEIYGICDSFI